MNNTLNEIPSTFNAYDVLLVADGVSLLEENSRNHGSSFDENDKDLCAINMLVTDSINPIPDEEVGDDENDDNDRMSQNSMSNCYRLTGSNHDDHRKIQPLQQNVHREMDNYSTQSSKYRAGFELDFEKYPGNNRFYIFISMYRRQYMDLNSQGDEAGCDEIERRIVSIICDECNPPGKFIEYDPFDFCNNWKQIDREDAVRRVKMAFLNPPTVTSARTFPYHTIHQVLTDDIGRMSEKHTITTGMSSTAVYNTKDTDRGQLSIASYGRKSLESDYLDNFLDSGGVVYSTSQRQSNSISYDASSSIDAVHLRFSSSLKMKRNRRRQKVEVEDKFRRRGVLATCWQEEEIENDMDDNQVTVDLGKETFLVNSELTKLVEKNFTAINDRSIRDAIHDDSIIADIGEDFGRVKITTSDTGSLQYKRKRKYEKKDKNEQLNIIKQYQIEHTKVNTLSGGLRNLSELDILCQMGSNYHPKPLNVNHIGNNRLRAIIQMNLPIYKQTSSCKASRNHVIFRIMSDICVGKKGPASFLYPQDTNLWAEHSMHIACRILMNFLEQCLLDSTPALYQLPPCGTPVFIRKSPIITMKILQQDSLRVIRRRRKKRSNHIIRDVGAVEASQRAIRSLHDVDQV